MVNKSGFQVLSWNAQSIMNKKHELLHHLQENRIPVALISQTHLRPSDKFSTRNYTSYRSDRPNRREGGVAIILHKSTKHIKIDLPQLNRLEAVAVRVNVDRHPVTLVSVYNPPGDINSMT